MDVTNLVQEERFIQPLALVEEDRFPESEAGDVRRAERPPTDAQGETADAEARIEKLGETLRQ